MCADILITSGCCTPVYILSLIPIPHDMPLFYKQITLCDLVCPYKAISGTISSVLYVGYKWSQRIPSSASTV